MKKQLIVITAVLMATALAGNAQPCHTDAPAVHSVKELRATIQVDAGKRLVNLQQLIPGLVVDLRYATTNNFTHALLYRHSMACMRAAPAAALLEVQRELDKKGLGLKIYDAWRPLSATCRIWALIPDRHYAANPRKGSHHNRGIAADLTIVDLKTGKELDMGTGFDNFTDSAHHDYALLPPKVIANRKLLKYVMWKHGFNFVPTEWWHYHWRDKARYEVIDLDFDDIRTIIAN